MARMPQRERKNQAKEEAAPYKKGGRKGANKGDGKDGNNGTRGGRGKGRGLGKGRGSRGEKKKPTTADDLDADMDKYWGKSSEHAQKKLDGDMDDYWKKKGEAVVESSAEGDAATPTTNADADKVE
ncbi:hypothetical protein H310_07897 [Aphanomyces invadans]|uniref:Chromatin target of PRMT1 protein C-terminal domain-containing protein n=1 Tax=Aphanomyces invadans TaxID=157072 RepID=A0A024U2N1_9STRA|nr:hypothetical protein H310_07897 [Aphanomyces invadans]ETV99862.1 hypothetical protein H310_07897 [Aphanomyces invadans]RHY31044.1 hypothetical protein DYB32_006225 [Aphanomyces invadans]|eukprot:XP_008871638.1 hypothetical protein H310_07897 [Aphanomyces invadans]